MIVVAFFLATAYRLFLMYVRNEMRGRKFASADYAKNWLTRKEAAGNN